MLLAYALNGRAQHTQVIDVRRVRIEGSSQGFGLMSTHLACLIKDIIQYRGVGEKVLVEEGSNRVAVLLDNWHGCLDGLDPE